MSIAKKYTLLFCLLTLSLLGGESRLEFIREQSEKVLSQIDPAVQVSIQLLSLTTGETLYELNPHIRMVPASSAKLYTAAASLDRLGSDFTFETALYLEGAMEKGLFTGSLFLKGSGDPSLRKRDLKELILQLKESGVSRIQGALVIDASDFDEMAYGPGWMWDDRYHTWCAPLSALNLDEGCFSVWIENGMREGEAPVVRVGLTDEKVSIDNQARVANQSQDLKVERLPFARGQPLQITGSVEKGSAPLKFNVATMNPDSHAAFVFKQLLMEAGIHFEGATLFYKTPSTARKVAVHRSAPLSNLLAEVLKESNNFYSDALFKKMGQLRNGALGTWTAGSQAVRDFLSHRVGIEPQELVLLDGCGLSRYNLTSAHQLNALLRWVHEEAPFAEDFKKNLPILGVDGSLKNRLATPRFQGKVIAKTGGMTGISALSGYLITQDRELIAFTILSNGSVGSVREIKARLEDALIAEWVTIPRPSK